MGCKQAAHLGANVLKKRKKQNLIHINKLVNANVLDVPYVDVL